MEWIWKKNKKNFKVKSILKKLNVEPLKKTTIKFLNWFSEYNIIPKGMALKLVLLSSNAVEKLSDKKYDENGLIAKSGKIDKFILEQTIDNFYYNKIPIHAAYESSHL